MSYEHCDSHDMDATNGCPVCNPFPPYAENLLHDLKQSVESRSLELWHYVKEARAMVDEARAERRFHGGHSCYSVGQMMRRLQQERDQLVAYVRECAHAGLLRVHKTPSCVACEAGDLLRGMGEE